MFQKHNEEPQKTLIIVCDEKENSCANYLIQLIGDKNDNNIDLNVKAVLYNTKTYRDNLGQIPSSQRVLFIGVNKFTKEQVGTIPDKYNELDMHFGWLGKRAVLYVDDITDNISNIINIKKNYEKFLEYSLKYDMKYENIIDSFLSIKKQLSTGAFYVVGTIFGASKVAYDLNKIRVGIKKQKYQTLIKIFYEEGLKDFMEG